MSTAKNRNKLNKFNLNYILQKRISQITRAKIQGKIGNKAIIFMLSSGANKSFISQRLAYRLQIEAIMINKHPKQNIVTDGKMITLSKKMTLPIRLDKSEKTHLLKVLKLFN